MRATVRQWTGIPTCVGLGPTKTLAKVGLDYEALRKLKDDIILTNITAYGAGGPERDSIGFDGTGQAMSGAIHLSGWEDQPRFRVYVHGGTVLDGHDWTGGATATYDVTGADVLQVVDWAQRRATNGATYAIALVVDDRQDRRGLVWLLGIDGNDGIERDPVGRDRQRRMLLRRDHPVGVPEADRVPR